MGIYTGILTMKDSLEILTDLKINLTYDPVVQPLRTYPNGKKSECMKVICTLLIAAQITIVKIRNQVRCPAADDWINKMCSHSLLSPSALLMAWAKHYVIQVFEPLPSIWERPGCSSQVQPQPGLAIIIILGLNQ